MTVLNDWATLKVSGPDAETFLQGQLSCDVTKANEQQMLLGAYCNPQGRMIANFRLCHADAVFYLVLKKDILETTITALKKYAVFSKVELAAGSDIVAITGHAELDELHDVKLDDTFGAMQQTADFIIWREWYPPTRYMVLWKNKPTSIEDRIDWAQADIDAGMLWVEAATQEKLLPHRINWPQVGGINFNKGCYVGQEIIARMHYRGQIKHHMRHYVLKGESDLSVHVGDEIFNADAADKALAQIVAVAGDGSNDVHVLAVIKDTDADCERGVLGDGSVFNMEQFALPYSL
jgi:tRNA-modifying protein YgfZ